MNQSWSLTGFPSKDVKHTHADSLCEDEVIGAFQTEQAVLQLS
jgi:hypothetical protein